MSIHIFGNTPATRPITVKGYCPDCGDSVTFDSLRSVDLTITTHEKGIPQTGSGTCHAGLRSCPGADCHFLVFYIYDPSSGETKFFPPVKISFDKKNLPKKVLQAFEEAIDCFANECFMSTGMMIRKTLEEVCADRGATGDNLFKKIESLKTKVSVPNDFFDGLHNLRFLGNDAAHIESQVFASLGHKECQAGLNVLRMFLQSVYQYKSILEELDSLKS